MKIPEQFVVPDWIIEAVRVAPEGWTPPKDSNSAKAMLGEFQKFILCPPVLQVLCDMVEQLARIDSDVDEHRFDGIHDIFNQQQLIGEKRGMRQFFVKLNEIREQLVTTANQP